MFAVAFVSSLVFLLVLHTPCTVGAQDARQGILAWAKWGVENHARFHYRQVRPIQYSANLPWVGDCSGFVTFCYKQAGAPDPNGQNYNGQGYTGTLVSHGRQISKRDLIPGDVIVYGAGTGFHAAIIVEAGNDPMTISMGKEGDPHYVRVSWDGRQPQRFMRYDTTVRFPVHWPPGVAPPHHPAPAPPAPHKPNPAPAPHKPNPAPAPHNPAPAPHKPAPAPAPQQVHKSLAKCLVTPVNVRSGAGTGHSVLRTAQTGEVFVLSGEAVSANGYQWWHVTPCHGGTSGYMAIRDDWQHDCTCERSGGAAPAPAPRSAPVNHPAPHKPAPPAPPAHHPPAPAPKGGNHGDLVNHWKSVIRRIAPGAKQWIVDGVASAMPDITQRFAINTPNRQAFFLAQTAQESAGFITTTEFASGAEYNGRRDLGNTHPGDGPRFKGRGIIQLTGRSNYGTYGRILGVDFVGNPDLAARFPWAALTAAEYWKQRDINSCADRNDFICATVRINGGTNGLATRQLYLSRARAALGGSALRDMAVDAGTTTNGGFPMWAIGVVVGGLVVVGAFVLLLVVLVRRARNKEKYEVIEDNEPIYQKLSRRSLVSNEFSRLSRGGTVQPNNV